MHTGFLTKSYSPRPLDIGATQPWLIVLAQKSALGRIRPLRPSEGQKGQNSRQVALEVRLSNPLDYKPLNYTLRQAQW
jgi:hypothetical protein